MNLDIKKKPIKVLLDTNVLLSALGFGGKPREVLLLILEKKIQAIISPILLSEFHEVINKKFTRLADELPRIEKQIKKIFILVYPKESLQVVRDIDDNRVLEAAVEGECNFIVTGDRDLLELGSFQDIKIITPNSFLQMLGK